jgi:hypothetical protein
MTQEEISALETEHQKEPGQRILQKAIAKEITSRVHSEDDFNSAVRASKILFERLTFTVLRAPLRWLDTVPVGRVLNRFTADFAVFDSDLGADLAYLILDILEVVGIVAAA